METCYQMYGEIKRRVEGLGVVSKALEEEGLKLWLLLGEISALGSS